MRLSFLIYLLLTVVMLSAQRREEIRHTDRIDLVKGPNLRGRLIGYEFGKAVTLVDEAGLVHTVDWSDVKRVYFQYDSRPGRPDSDETDKIQEDPALLKDTPRRSWRHHLALRVGGTRESRPDPFDFGPTSNSVYSLGVSYHLLRRWSGLQIGPGIGYDLLSIRRQERMLSASLRMQYTLSDWRIRPFARMEGGITLPLGSESLVLESREAGTLVHPALGCLLVPATGQWGEIGLALGYRISRAGFRGTNVNLEVIERDITYRRLTISATAGF